MEDHDVVDIHHYMATFNALSENFIHHVLERGWAVAHPEEHYPWFKQTHTALERAFGFVSLSDTDIVEPCSNVHFGVVFGISQFVHDIGYEGERVTVLHCVLIEGSVILDWSERAILFRDKEEAG